MEQLRPAVFPFYAAQLHHNLAAASMSPDRFRFPGQPPFQFQAAAAAAMFPGIHPMAAHHHHHPGAHHHHHPHPAAAAALTAAHHHHQHGSNNNNNHQQHHQQQQHNLTATQAAVFPLQRGLPPTPQPAHSHHHHHLNHHLNNHLNNHHHHHHPHLSPGSSSSSQVVPLPLLQPQLSISQEELDMVLYGYTKGTTGGSGRDAGCSGHALSGLNLSHSAAAACPLTTTSSTTTTMSSSLSLAAAGDDDDDDGGGGGGGSLATTNAVAVALLSSSASSPASASSSSPAAGGGGGGGGATSTTTTTLGGTSTSNQEGGRELKQQQQQKQQQSEPVTFGIDKILSAPQSSPGSASSASTKLSKQTLDVASLELPEGLAVIQTTFVGAIHQGVFCTKTVIARGSRFGPFKGRIIHTSEIKTHDDNSHMWEIFQDGKLSHFIDGRGSAGNWMSLVKCARYAQEQNLIAVQSDASIWYEACKDIPQGTELLVWYGDCYLQFMGVPVALKEMADGGAQEEADTSEGFQCERCGKVFAYKYYRDKHLKYTRCVDQGDRKYPCTLCSRSFEKRDRLRIHILHVHEKHRPHKCMVCGKSFSQSSSLNKHMRVHSGERPYKCVYCNKAFTASSILRTHIRQHSGEKPFKCKHCGKAFASHAAHDSHVRRTHAKERTCTCSVCGKAFSQPFELKFHMTSHMKQ